jgi:hypothetical protein
MNANAKRWVEALRSGEFEQGQKVLTRRRADGTELDCCLGVACKLYVLDGGTLDIKIIGNDGSINSEYLGEGDSVIEYDDSAFLLPIEVRDWLGMTNDSGYYGDNDGSLAEDNDLGASFEEIAATIESEPKGLFR